MSDMSPDTPKRELLDPDELLGPDDDVEGVTVLDPEPLEEDISDAEIVEDVPAHATAEIEPVPAHAADAADAAMVVSPERTAVAAVAPDGVARTADPSAESGEDVEVECPGCGLTVVGNDPRPTASWFCPRCDYPLFLVRKPAAPEPDGATRGARRRLPGTSGRAITAAGPCWNCGEWNESGVTTCLRCAATLPKPVPPRIVAEVIPPELEPELVEVEVMYWPPVWIALLGGFGAGIAFLAGVLLATGRL